MCRETACTECEYKDDLRSCVKKHIEAARKLLDQGKIEEAKAELESLEKHLK
ncbi:MAG: hypothetical protein NDF55_00245 [archaeon GB-1867-005]|nr:hypothetical protein [Candidatus Culexmicrobium cathedralense]